MELVVVTQTVCNYCNMVKTFLKGEGVEFRTFNITEEDFIEINGEKVTQEDLGVMGTPTTILFDEGEEVARVVSFAPQELHVLIDQL